MSCTRIASGRVPLAPLAIAAAIVALCGFARAGWAHPFLDDRLVLLDAQIAADPSNGRLRLSRGSLLLDERRARAALADFERALELDESLSIAHLLSAQALLADGRTDGAVAAARRYVELERESANGWRSLARVLAARSLTTGEQATGGTNDEREALAAFDRYFALAVDPTPDDSLERAALQRRAGRPDDALRGLEAGIERLGPLTALLRTGLEIERERGELRAALGYAERLVGASPQVERWQLERARLLRQLGRDDEALAAVRAAEASLARRSAARRFAPALVGLAKEIDRMDSELAAPRGATVKER